MCLAREADGDDGTTHLQRVGDDTGREDEAVLGGEHVGDVLQSGQQQVPLASG